MKKQHSENENLQETVALDLSHEFPLLPLRDALVTPGASTRILVGRAISQNALRISRDYHDLILLALQVNPDKEAVSVDDLPSVGVLAHVQSVTVLPNGCWRVLLEGIVVVDLANAELDENRECFLSKISLRYYAARNDDSAKALLQNGTRLFERYAALQNLSPDIVASVKTKEDPFGAYMAMLPFLRISPAQKQLILEQVDLENLGCAVDTNLKAAIEAESVAEQVRDDVQQKMQQNQKEWFIGEQIRLLQNEISGGDGDEIEKLVRKVQEKHFSPAIQEKLDEEFGRMRLMQPASPEYAVSRNYIDWFLSIPYGVYTDTDLDLKKVKKNLDSGHYGLDKVKERILEYVAVLKLTQTENKAPIICLVGPPGVGKTTLVRSIAESLGRNFARVTLGGVQDEAEIRGHRRTYIGSMPGRFIQALRHAKCMNPVILLDEIDKMGNDYRGDPASAMLEVLDPELNGDFTDHFMEVGLDFSKVLFIATANSEETIPAPLADRMEVVRLPGYYPHEKLSIAKDYLVPKVLGNCGVKDKKAIVFEEDSLRTVLREYTREAGVRELERMIETIVRKRVKEMLMGKSGNLTLTPKLVEKYLGVPRFLANRLPAAGHFGVITGLAWTSVGGEILLIETKLLSGRGHLLLTGKLGDVMKESAQIALSLVRERLLRFDIDPAIVRKTDIHIHVPEGAVPKDGPSAGIALTLSLLSAFTRTPVNPEIAFTGEVSLSGDLLPIGGLNEKALAALDAGVKTLYLPKQNEKDIAELPAPAKKGLKIHTKNHIDELISILFPKSKKKASRAKKDQNVRTDD